MSREKKSLKMEYGRLVRAHLHDDGFELSLPPGQFIKLRRAVRRKATHERAEAAFRAYMAVLDLPIEGSYSQGQPLQKLAALAISAKRIAKLGAAASLRLTKIAEAAKKNETNRKPKRNGHISEGIALGK